MPLARRYWLISISLRKSSASTTPGCTGLNLRLATSLSFSDSPRSRPGKRRRFSGFSVGATRRITTLLPRRCQSARTRTRGSAFHFHCCIRAGVFEPAHAADGAPGVVFHAASGLDAAAVATVQAQVRRRVLRPGARTTAVGGRRGYATGAQRSALGAGRPTTTGDRLRSALGLVNSHFFLGQGALAGCVGLRSTGGRFAVWTRPLFAVRRVPGPESRRSRKFGDQTWHWTGATLSRILAVVRLEFLSFSGMGGRNVLVVACCMSGSTSS